MYKALLGAYNTPLGLITVTSRVVITVLCTAYILPGLLAEQTTSVQTDTRSGERRGAPGEGKEGRRKKEKRG